MILTPVLLLLVLVAVQAALVFHARSVVSAAAQDAARAVQREGGTESQGVSAATALLGGSEQLLVSPAISIVRGDRNASASISAEVLSVVPFWHPSVSAESSGPLEEFRSEAER